ncbi:TPA: hypothetical protein KRO81_001813 [Clostridioides difficile]|uniref:Uncharacterized protein n=1 Tax=Clostridioides difficile NAP08 TaxID=525259 RepID=D5Q008_CLODI|nr:hypothetical protein [Clostridioides difficile]EFH08835.1 hypothetical protein HMPREF0220_0240 [Clostridioides difficile NAP08]EFH14001.1 hypothetical protein HMPREF0219_3286 [Clostridioides difficile NAP07]CCK89250.1 conserved hypothetical protein [Clostridioides difficile T5]CCK92634.1 conserved hypothetical protein [Clostridioides difficile T20]CCL00411.1 conserved hypothetical protein [Clostridioides difficile E10]
MIDNKYIFRGKNIKNYIKFKDITGANKQDSLIYLKALSIEREEYLINRLKSFF